MDPITEAGKIVTKAAAVVEKAAAVVPIVLPTKTSQELEQELREAHSELLATARICYNFKGRMTKANLQGIGESAMEALSQYFLAHNTFSKHG